jgi:hypothetical protein
MAKYNRQSTNKYYGAGNAGYVRSGSASDGLAKSLASASQAVGIAENLKINNKKDAAIEKIQALEASGKTLADIQSEILAGKHPDLTGKYINATTQFHSGKVKAAEVITEITKAMETDYDITKHNINDFTKDYIPEMEGQDSSFMAGFGSFYNVWKQKTTLADAQERGELASQKKIDEVRQILSVIPNEDLDTRYVEEWKSFGTALRTSDNQELTKFYTNEELMEAIRQDVGSIIDTATTLEDIERAEKIMSLNLGQGTNGQELGSLNSRKNQNTDVLKAALTAKKDAVIQKARRDETYNTAKATQAVWVEAYTPNEDGTPKSTLQIQELLRQITIASKGDRGTIESFTEYFNSDPKSRMIKDYKGVDDFLLSISLGEFDSHKDMMKAMIEEGIPDSEWDSANKRWDRYQKSSAEGAIPPIYDTDHHYVNTKNSIIKQVTEKYTKSDDGTGTANQAEADVLRYIDTEIEKQEMRWEDEGLDITSKMRKDFITEIEQYALKTWTGNDEDEFKAPETLTMETERARIVEEEKLEAEEIAKQEKQEETDNTVVFQRGGEPVTLKQFSNEIVENLNNIDAPKLIETVIGGIIDEDRKFELQTQPKIKKYINEVLGVEFDADILAGLSDDDFDLISETITKKLNLPFSDDNTENLDMIQDLIFSLYNLEG